MSMWPWPSAGVGLNYCKYGNGVNEYWCIAVVPVFIVAISLGGYQYYLSDSL